MEIGKGLADMSSDQAITKLNAQLSRAGAALLNFLFRYALTRSVSKRFI